MKEPSTATNIPWDDFKDERGRVLFDRMCQDFFAKWQPDDRQDLARFHADLQSLVRQIYIDAQAPANTQLMAVLEAVASKFMLNQKPITPRREG